MVLQNLEITQLSNQALSIFFTRNFQIQFTFLQNSLTKAKVHLGQVKYFIQDKSCASLVYYTGSTGAYIGPLSVFRVNLPRQMVVI